VPKGAVEAVKGLLLERSSGDLRASATIEDTVDQFDVAYEVFQKHPELSSAMDLEGNYKGFGIHAAGLVVSKEPITKVCAILERKMDDGEIKTVVSMDGKDAERQGLDKLDFLSLSTMDMVAEALHLLDMSVEELYEIDDNDPTVIEGFKENDVVGVFQFDGRATRSVNLSVQPDNFDELAYIVALSRPGPLHNGAVQGYCSVKHGLGERESLHPALDRITEAVNYQVIFQEQIIRIARDIGGFDRTGAADVRRIIAKKKGEQEFNRKWSKFREGALTLHEREPDLPPMTEEIARKVWGLCITAGAYAFNAAHSYSYARIAVWCMWFKRHHPEVFFAASLKAYQEKKDKLPPILRDAGAKKKNLTRRPVELLPPAPWSEPSWTVESEDSIRAGFAQLNGIGVKTAAAIERAREYHDFEEWEDLTVVKGVGPKTVEKARAFAERKDPFEAEKLADDIAQISDTLRDGIVDASGRSLPVPTHTAEEVFQAQPDSRIVLLGQPVKRNLRDLYEVNQKKGEEVDPNIKRPDLAQWVVFAVQDPDELATFIVSRFKYPRFKELIWKIKTESEELVLFEGKKGKPQGLGDQSGICFVDQMWVMTP
jgi:DNA polymerase-3 subunit alpha